MSIFERVCPLVSPCCSTIPCPFNSKTGKKAHVLTHEVVQAVQYNAIRESTMPKRVPRSSGRHNDFGLKQSTYRCVTLATALLLFQH